MTNTSSMISEHDFFALAETEMPFLKTLEIEFDKLDREETVVRSLHRGEYLRPGGTVAGPVMMTLADVAIYAVIMANIGLVSLAVTTNLNINFLRKPPPADLLASARVLKLGKRLAVCECSIHTAATGEDNLVAHATGTYSIPSG
ncbi:MAG: PaaI family thioesterase [Pseudomonadota bacterium]